MGAAFGLPSGLKVQSMVSQIKFWQKPKSAKVTKVIPAFVG
jgi:hypothetical protein